MINIAPDPCASPAFLTVEMCQQLQLVINGNLSIDDIPIVEIDPCSYPNSTKANDVLYYASLGCPYIPPPIKLKITGTWESAYHQNQKAVNAGEPNDLWLYTGRYRCKVRVPYNYSPSSEIGVQLLVKTVVAFASPDPVSISSLSETLVYTTLSNSGNENLALAGTVGPNVSAGIQALASNSSVSDFDFSTFAVNSAGSYIFEAVLFSAIDSWFGSKKYKWKSIACPDHFDSLTPLHDNSYAKFTISFIKKFNSSGGSTISPASITSTYIELSDEDYFDEEYLEYSFENMPSGNSSSGLPAEEEFPPDLDIIGTF